MIGAVRLVISPGAVVAASEEHADCACLGVVVELPDGSRLLLDADHPDTLVALGLEIASIAESIEHTRAARQGAAA